MNLTTNTARRLKEIKKSLEKSANSWGNTMLENSLMSDKEAIISFKNELKEIIDNEIKELRKGFTNTQGLSDYLIGRMRGSLDTLIELRKKFIKEIESVEQNGETTNK